MLMRDSADGTPVTAGLYIAAATIACGLVAVKTFRNHTNTSGESEEDLLLSKLGRKGLREVQKKQKLKEKHFEKGAQYETSPQMTRQDIPPGNFATPNWICLDLGLPVVATALHPSGEDAPRDKEIEEKWSLSLSYGPSKQKKTIRLADIEGLASFQKLDNMPWHCVTGWSKQGLTFWGAPMKDVIALLGLSPAEESRWTWAFQRCADGYTCPVMKEDLLSDEAFFITRHSADHAEPKDLSNGENKEKESTLPPLISFQHGGPRLYMPFMFGWKMGKWITTIEIMDTYRPGFWEKLTSHARGRVYDPTSGLYVNERWAPELGIFSSFLTKVPNFLGLKLSQILMVYGKYTLGFLFFRWHKAVTDDE